MLDAAEASVMFLSLHGVAVGPRADPQLCLWEMELTS